MGIKTVQEAYLNPAFYSEKPPHHMGIKTQVEYHLGISFSLKNLPTTWGLRRIITVNSHKANFSEKPPRHSGIIQR